MNDMQQLVFFQDCETKLRFSLATFSHVCMSCKKVQIANYKTCIVQEEGRKSCDLGIV